MVMVDGKLVVKFENGLVWIDLLLFLADILTKSNTFNHRINAISRKYSINCKTILIVPTLFRDFRFLR